MLIVGVALVGGCLVLDRVLAHRKPERGVRRGRLRQQVPWTLVLVAVAAILIVLVLFEVLAPA